MELTSTRLNMVKLEAIHNFIIFFFSELRTSGGIHTMQKKVMTLHSPMEKREFVINCSSFDTIFISEDFVVFYSSLQDGL